MDGMDIVLVNLLVDSFVFGEHTGLSEHCRFMINEIKSNSRYYKELALQPEVAALFTNLAWKLLGLYIVNNTRLTNLGLGSCGISNEKMELLCSGLRGSKPELCLVGSVSLRHLDLKCNQFGIEGLRSMIPFLECSTNLKELSFSRNNNFDNECFELLVQTLHYLSAALTVYLSTMYKL